MAGMNRKWLGRTLVVLLLVDATIAHVRLVYPQARAYDLDFLDNVRTRGPCGMPSSDKSKQTVLEEGSSFNATWHLAYPHRGGFRLEILNSTQQPVYSLTGGDAYLGSDDVTSLTYRVTLPTDFTCDDCTVRLLRQASEWGGGYRFWSCADVKIIPAADYTQTCSGNGAFDNGKCTCNRLYHGEFCQFKDDCMDRSDCNNWGQCIDVDATSYPKHQCFCDAGYHGQFCEKKSSVDSIPTDLSKYQMTTFANGRYSMYWRILQASEEIEVLLDVQTDNWVGLGLRPGDSKGCPQWSKPGDQGSNAEGEGEGEKATGEPDAEKPTAEADPESSSEPNSESETSPEPEGESPTPEGESPTAETNAEVSPEGEGDDEDECPKPSTAEPGAEEPTAESSSEPDGESPTPESESETSAEPEGEKPTAEAEGETTPEGEGEGEGTSEGETGGGTTLDGMACLDVVLGMARGSRSRVYDAYTRDRATPRHDVVYGGTESLTGAVGEEANGRTRILIRRKLAANDEADQPITNSVMHVAWAYGQRSNKFKHWPPSGLERGEGDNTFYRRDEIKYHGKGACAEAMPRGSATINFYGNAETWDPVTCSGGYTGGDYSAEYSYNMETKMAHFKITLKQAGNQWTGIGFSKDDKMPNSDVVVAWNDGNGGAHMDGYLSTYATPTKDDTQDVKNVEVTAIGGSLVLEFDRAADTGDSQDVNLGECVYFFFPTRGGAASGTLGRHASTPVVSSRKVCLNQCGDLTEVFVRVIIRLTKEPWTPALADKMSTESLDLSNRLKRQLTMYYKPDVLDFNEGSVLAEVEVGALSAPGAEDQTRADLTEDLRKDVSDGFLGELAVDPDYFQVLGDPGLLLSILEIVLITVGCVLVLILFVFCLLKCQDTCGSAKVKDEEKQNLANRDSPYGSSSGSNSYHTQNTHRTYASEKSARMAYVNNYPYPPKLAAFTGIHYQTKDFYTLK